MNSTVTRTMDGDPVGVEILRTATESAATRFGPIGNFGAIRPRSAEPSDRDKT